MARSGMRALCLAIAAAALLSRVGKLGCFVPGPLHRSIAPAAGASAAALFAPAAFADGRSPLRSNTSNSNTEAVPATAATAPAAAPAPFATRDLPIQLCCPRYFTMCVSSSLLPSALLGIVPGWAGGDTRSVKNFKTNVRGASARAQF